MCTNPRESRYLVESERCAVLARGDGAYLLGYFRAPNHEWTCLTAFEDEAAARRAFAIFDKAAAVCGPNGAATRSS